jgi:tripartite ATP-independent transporter DctP family solute receptor
MKKFSIVSVVCFLFSVGFLVAFQTQILAASEEEVFHLKFASHEPEQGPQGEGLKKMKEVAEQLSGGRIKISIFNNSSLYPQDAELDALISGELDMCTIEPARYADYIPSLGFVVAPFTFAGYDHMRKVMGRVIGKEISERVSETNNYILLSVWYYGARNINSRTTKPIVAPDDLKGVLLRMPATKTWLSVGESLGAIVTPLAFGEIYTALQTGTIDAQDNPLSSTFTNKFYEVTKQVSLTNHLLSLISPSINKDTWNKMGPELQEIMQKAAEAGREANDALVLKDEKELISFFKDKGLVITEPDRNAFKEFSQKYYSEKGFAKEWDRVLMERIDMLR